ncbi:MAG TPA: DUF3471 domain-containing protein [Chitinophagaceae bacterium]|nr:DUF3471 domain-containing protein [Chitinophagaceae bacterium]
MKQLLAWLLLLIPAITLHAQLANTQWKSTVIIGNPVGVILDFKKDSCSLYTVGDSTIIEIMTYKATDTVLTVVKVEGQSDCDITTPGKYRYNIQNNLLTLQLLADDCEDRSTVIADTKWKPWIIPPEVKVSEAILRQYVGTYEMDSTHPIYITLDNGRLYAEGPNNQLPKSPLTAESNTRFFLRIAGVSFDFVKDAGGKVVSFISHEDKDYELKKVQ